MSDKIKVLCVEDEKDFRESLVAIMENEGFEAFGAEDGKIGLEMFLERSPDVIICDVMMPNTDGYELLESIRTNKSIDNNNVPFFLLSALSQKESILKGITLEASEYITKPVDFDVLAARIREKIANTKKNQQLADQNISNLKSQISSVVPHEMTQYIDLINNIAGLLRTEVYGPLPHKKYLDDINKIYISSLKLKTTVNNFLSGSAISNHLDEKDEVVHPLEIVQDFIGSLNKKFNNKVVIGEFDITRLSNIKIDKKVLTDVIQKMVGCMFKVNSAAVVNIIISDDHLGRVVFIFYPEIKLDRDILEDNIEEAIPSSILDGQGLVLEMSNSNNTSMVLSVPDYRVVSKKKF